MRAIAQRLKVSPTALYQHFDGKDEILHEIRLRGTRQLLEEVFAPAPTLEDPRERLCVALHRYVEFARIHRWLYAVVMGEVRVASVPEEQEFLRRPLELIQASLEEGVRRGCWREDLDLEMASHQIWLAMHGLCVLLHAGRLTASHPAFRWGDAEAFTDAYIRRTVACVHADVTPARVVRDIAA